MPLTKGDAKTKLSAIRADFPDITDFERSFPNLCFSLATGVGKTRLMGAFVAYLHIAHGIGNFFILAPNLTIYNKLITDFTPNTPKYVLQGISEFASSSPSIVTGDNYMDRIAGGRDLFPVTINIFNISKIDAEMRNGHVPRIRAFREEVGESYFEHLSGLSDLVMIMDESHRYRASQGVRVLNDINPLLGLELTATPFIEAGNRTTSFRNVIFHYPLAKAMEDGFVKEPAVVTRANFSTAGHSPETIQRIKLEDGIRLHESVKAELVAYAKRSGLPVVKPFILVIARDTIHAAELLTLIMSDDFFSGHYAGKVIQVDSSIREDETISRLLQVERADEPTEIVIHVNMLKEGWDVTNLYTIVPLRTANARVLIEQSIGRGLRLPYGHRTGIAAIDRLNIVAHDRFQEIVDEARKPGSPLRLEQVILTDDNRHRTITVASEPALLARLGIGTLPVRADKSDPFDPDELPIARAAYEAIQNLGADATVFPCLESLVDDGVQQIIIENTQSRLDASATAPADIKRIVRVATQMVIDQTIAIPKLSVRPRTSDPVRLKAFDLDVTELAFQPVEAGLVASHLRTGVIDRIAPAPDHRIAPGDDCEDIIVNHLIARDDIAYEDGPDDLYALTRSAVGHLRSYLNEADLENVVQFHGQRIADIIHRQILAQRLPDGPPGFVATVTRGFSELRQSTYTTFDNQPILDVWSSPPVKATIGQHIFQGFARCLYPLQKFQSDPERVLALILDRDSLKWFKPAFGQFDISYSDGSDVSDYQPDFVAETASDILILEAKAEKDMSAADVLAKRDAAIEWCEHASRHTALCGGKPWSYLLIPHTALAENMSLDGLVSRFKAQSRRS